MNDRDKTKQQLAEEVAALRENEQRLRLLLETAPLGIYECDTEGIILKVNPAAERITGYGMAELIGVHIWGHLKLGPQKESLIAHLRSLAAEQSRPTPHFITVPTKSGRSVQVQLDWSFRRNAEHEIIGFFAVVSDITARIEAESALQESEGRYRLLTETVPQLIWRANGNGVLECNRHWYDYTGQTPEEAQGYGWMTAVHPDDLDRVTEAMFRSLQDGAYEAEYRLRRASDGSYRWHLARALPMKDKQGNILYSVGSATDIDDRKRIEEGLRRSEERFRRVAENAPFGVSIDDSHGHVLFVNDEFQRIFGYTLQEIPTQADWYARAYPDEEYRKRVFDAWDDDVRRMRAGEIKRSPVREYHVTCRDGSVKNVEITFAVEDDHTYVVFNDITVKKLAEETLKGIRAKLEQRVEQRTAELTKANEALHDSESRLTFALEVSATGAWDLNLADHTAHRSLQHDRIFGYESLLTAWTYERFLEHVVPEDRDAVDRQFRQAVDCQGDWSFNCRIRRNDGQIRWIWAAGRHRPDIGGNPQRMVGIVQDITDRRRAEEALRASEERYHALFNSMTEGFALHEIVTDASGRPCDYRYLDANPAFERLMGMNRGEVLGRLKREVTPGEDEFWIQTYGSVALGGPPARFEHRSANSQRYWQVYAYSPAPRQFAVLFTDITARKQAEEKLHQSQAVLDAFFSASTAILNIFDDQYRYIKTDNLTPTYFGLDAQSIIGRSLKDDLAPQFIEEFGPMIRRVVETGEPVHNVEVKSVVSGRPGEVIYWRASYFPVALPGGKRGYGVVGVEINDIKRAEAALRESENKYRTLVETSPDAVVLTDLQGQVVFASHGILDLDSSEKVDGVIGKHPLDFIAEADHPRLLANLQRTLEEGVTRDIEYTFVRKDGTRFPGEVSGAVIRDAEGNPTALMAVVRDITERKQAQEATEESETKLRTLFHILPVGISILDERRRVVDLNPALEHILGLTKEQLQRGDYTIRRYLRSDGSPMPPEEFPSVVALKEGRVVSNVEVGVVKEDTSTVWTLVSAAPLPVDGLGAAVVTRDITEHKRVEEALARERRTLKHMLQASDHERQLIAYDIHDGLAQQLAGAIMQFQIYAHARETSPKDAAQALEAGLTMLRQSHAEARRLISGVRPPILDESGVVAAVAHLVHDPAFDHGPKIELRSKVTFVRLASVVENTIYRIVQEGISNARHHSKSKKIVVGLVQRGDRLRIEIRDWGVGFDPTTRQENRFGLEGIRERARLLGGKCDIKSQPGEGTSIVVELPVVEREA